MTEPRATDHHPVFLPALCWNRRYPDFYAVTQDISARGIAFRSAVVPEAGELITCSIRHIGLLDARVSGSQTNAFVVRLSVSRQRAAEVARTMLALSREQGRPLSLRAAHPRVTPKRRDVLVTLENGEIVPGRLINVSASGAAVSLARPLEVGAQITIGRTLARVVRSFREGVGAMFAAPLDPARVDAGIRL